MKNSKMQKTITRHVWKKTREKANALRRTKWGKKVYARRKETAEWGFADAKQHHGHRYARFHSLLKVQMPCLQAATAQNMKKMAFLLAVEGAERVIREAQGAFGVAEPVMG